MKLKYAKNCFQSSFNFAFKFILRRYSLVHHAWGHHAWGPRLRDLTLASIVTLQFGTIVASVNALADIFASVPTSVLSGGGGRVNQIIPATSFYTFRVLVHRVNGIVGCGEQYGQWHRMMWRAVSDRPYPAAAARRVRT
jgi:hypothetical protein